MLYRQLILLELQVENTSTNALQICNGSSWADVDATTATVSAAGSDGQVQYNDGGVLGGDAAFIWDDTNNRLGIDRATPVVALDINGALRVGADVTACSGTISGAIRYDTTDNELEYCNGTAWLSINHTSDTGTAPTSTTGMGYFVLSSATTTGNLGGIAGANTWCYNDLNANNWNGKADATSRGIFTTGNVRALLMENYSNYNFPMPNITYIFARSGHATYGGATFTTDGSGLGPYNAQYWSGTNYFGGVFEYWTGFYQYNGGTEEAWGPYESGSSMDCGQWTQSGSGDTGLYAFSNSNTHRRWGDPYPNTSCNRTLRVICMVHP